jgi:NAD(P)H-binding
MRPLWMVAMWAAATTALSFDVTLQPQAPVTQTRTEVLSPALRPVTPKIVVLGATGRIGRHVIRELLSCNSDVSIVAVVRSEKKAQRLFYDGETAALVPRAGRSGPQLQIVTADLVSQHEVLEQALKGCTVVISCVGAVRWTNLFSDILSWPVHRLLQRDVSDWCTDAKHPYYVHYGITRRVLAIAEREQLRRQEQEVHERIRLVRISDLCVAQSPWHLVPLVTNMVQSLVFRYQDMAEQLLASTNLLDTIIIRPGDLVDDERDTEAVSVQVSPTGLVPLPAVVGRRDVASLAVAAALLQIPHQKRKAESNPMHFTLAIRWTGQDMAPYPPQGRKRDGHASAAKALQSCVKVLSRQYQNGNSTNYSVGFGRNSKPLSGLTARQKNRARLLSGRTIGPPTQVKPYGVCVAIPLYLGLAMVATSLLQSVVIPLLPFSPRRLPFPVENRGWFLRVGGVLLAYLWQWAQWTQYLLYRLLKMVLHTSFNGGRAHNYIRF